MQEPTAGSVRVPPDRPEITRALEFIGANLHRPLTAGDVARAARLSEFHLQRLFHAAVGESLGRFVTGRRLEQAALRLVYESERAITEIAVDSGYSSSSNFSTAFSAFFGCTPTQLREPQPNIPAKIGKLLSSHGRDFQPRDLYTLASQPDRAQRSREAAAWEAAVRFESLPGQPFACLASPGGYALGAIEATWTELIQRARRLQLVEDAVDAWGVAHDSPQLTAPELCRYHACLPCSAHTTLDAPLFHGRMEPGRYAVFHYAGPVSGVADAYRSIYACWFPESSLAPDNFQPLDHYVGDFPQAGQAQLELWFKVRPRQRQRQRDRRP